MKSIADYKNPFDAILEFESAVARYTGAPYCVTTDCCTHAMEIAFRLNGYDDRVTLPARTYLSVPMVLHKLKISYILKDVLWRGSYQFEGSNIWDCARQFEPSMYQSGTIQCISFGRTKPLQIGQGGCLLTDNEEIYRAASMMRSDGRDLFQFSPWITQKTFRVGYHYTMRPEECVVGLNLLNAEIFTEQLDKYFDYPDCRDIVIHD
jgi:dTDP-4-amino-4,6-dideoxygalactose transaminase